jgi:type II secretory pathway pseudopilin PulG
MVIVIVILGITAAWAVPSWQQIQRDLRLKEATRTVSNAFSYARSQAVLTERNHIVFLAVGGGTDACGNALVDAAGNPVPVLVLDDGPPGGALGNCCIDAGEAIYTEAAVPNVNWGVTFAPAGPADDTGLGAFASGATFADPFGVATTWVMFRPDGVPVGFTGACVAGQIGTGRGAVYMTNGNRDYAALLTPLGSTKIYAYDRSTGAWND